MEKVLLPEYLREYGGCLFREVRVGTKYGSKEWGYNASHRAVDGVLFADCSLGHDRMLPYSPNSSLFLTHVELRKPISLLEAKTELNPGLIGQVIAGFHLLRAELGVTAKRLVAVVPKAEADAAVESFCKQRGIRVAKVRGVACEWPKDNEDFKLELLEAYGRRPDVTGRIYRNVPVGGPATYDLYGGSASGRRIDAVRIFGPAQRHVGQVPVLDFSSNSDDFFRRASRSKFVEVIEIPRTHDRGNPRKLNRGVLGKLLVSRHMLTLEWPGMTITHMAALCRSSDDALAFACNAEGITVEGASGRYIQTPKV